MNLRIIIVLSLLLSVCFLLAANLHVGYGQQYSTINAAKNAAQNGDTIIIHPGNYAENLYLNNLDVNVMGSTKNPDDVTIDGSGYNGIYIRESISNISNLTITNAALAIRTWDAESVIDNCVLINNYSGIVGLYSDMEIKNCIVDNNTYQGIHFDGEAPRAPTVITNTQITNNDGGVGINNGSITNCTIYNNRYGVCQSSGTGDAPTVINSIVYGNTQYQLGATVTDVTYSDIEGGATGTGNINAYPMFINSGAGNFNLEPASPCVDAGDPAITDPDGTRSDMGSRLLDYRSDSWNLYSYNAGDRTRTTIKWQGLPALDTFSTNGTVAENVFAEIMGEIPGSSTTLDNAFWKELETGFDFEIYEQGNIWYNDNKTLSRIQGYKFQVVANLTQNVDLNILGEQVPDNTVIPLRAGMENWTCYHLDKTQDWDEAFGSSLSNIYSVQTQYWTRQRTMPKPTAPWQDVIYQDLTLSRGDMVIIKCFNDEDFTWNNGLISIPVAPAMSTAFTFEEELDYVPVYVEFDAENAPVEVAVLADGVCQGAAVVDNGGAEICAYITDNAGEDLELEFYYGERSAVESVNNFKVFNPEANCFVSKSIVINPNEDYYQISLREEEESVEEAPVKASLINYPNPFNPTTTVSFNVPVETNVELGIYNVKGQLVKALVNEVTPAGTHSVEWNGIDNSGQKVSSGIYFSHLKTNKEVLNEKMILLK